MFRTRPGASLPTIHAGHGPLVVLCHGVTDCAASLYDLMLRLADRYHVVAIDSLGHGIARRATPAELEDPMSSALRALEDTLDPLVHRFGPAIGIGHSMGGSLLTRLASQRPDLFAGVVGEDPSWFSPMQAESYRQSIPSSLSQHHATRQNPAGTLAHNRMEYPTWPETERAGWLAGKLHVDLDFIAAGNVGFVDWRQWAPGLSVPTLIVTGDGRDVVLGENGLKDIAALGNPLIETRLITGSRHCVRRENPAAFQAVIDEFLARTHPAPDPETALRKPGEPARVLPPPSPTSSFFVDEQLRPALNIARYPQWDVEGSRKRGADYAAQARATAPAHTDVRLEVRRENGVHMRIWHPKNPERVLLAIHGGGFIAGSAADDDVRNAELSRLLNAIVVSPDYRLAPEHPYPAAVTDCLTAVDWAHASWDLPLVIAGDSAGGHLAEATTAMALEGGLSVAGVIMLEPFLDPSMSARSIRIHAQAQTWNRMQSFHAWRTYLAGTDPRMLPRLIDHAKRPDRPRVLTIVASADLLRDEGIIWTTDLVDAGFAAQLHMLAGTYHAGLSMSGTHVWNNVQQLINDFCKGL